VFFIGRSLTNPLYNLVFFFICSAETKITYCYGICRVVSSYAEVLGAYACMGITISNYVDEHHILACLTVS